MNIIKTLKRHAEFISASLQKLADSETSSE
jgi:hypothetical protein